MSTMRRGRKTVIDNEQHDFLSATDQPGFAAHYWQLQAEHVKGREKQKELQVARLAAVMKLQRLYFPCLARRRNGDEAAPSTQVASCLFLQHGRVNARLFCQST
jgi:hypothetical protein